MTDANIRSIERAAASGDLQAQAALIQEQIRTHTLPGLGPRETECRGGGRIESGACTDCNRQGLYYDDDGTPYDCSHTSTLKDAESHAWEEGERACHVLMHETKDCPHCHGSAGKGIGTLPSDPMATVSLLAYWGCEASRLVGGHNASCECGHSWRDETEQRGHVGPWQNCMWCKPSNLAKGLLSLASKLPPLRLVGGVKCNKQAYHVPSQQVTECQDCNGTGRKVYTVPMERWTAVKVGVAVGRVCLPKWFADHARHGHWGRSVCCDAPRRALDAAEAWIRCPCPINTRICQNTETAVATWAHVATSLAWNPSTTISQIEIGLRGASNLIGEDTVRKIIQKVRP